MSSVRKCRPTGAPGFRVVRVDLYCYLESLNGPIPLAGGDKSKALHEPEIGLIGMRGGHIPLLGAKIVARLASFLWLEESNNLMGISAALGELESPGPGSRRAVRDARAM